MTQDLRPLFEDPSAPSALRNFVALARSDGPNQADLERLAVRVGVAVGVSAGVLLAGSTVSAGAALGTPPAQLVTAVQPGVAGKLAVLGKLFASGSAKLLAVGLSAGVGLGVWAYARPQSPANRPREHLPPGAASVEPAVEPVVEPVVEPAVPGRDRGARPSAAPAGEAESAPAQAAPAPMVTPLAPTRTRNGGQRSSASRAHVRRARTAELAAPVKDAEPSEQQAPAPSAELPSELSLIQQAEAARNRGAEALQLLATHQRLYPRGALAQEREVLAIELLIKIGKPEQARARAARFERSHPSSAHLPRVHALIERAGSE